MRKFILLLGNYPLALNGYNPNGILFTKEQAEARMNAYKKPDELQVLEISSIPVEIVTNKVSIV